MPKKRKSLDLSDYCRVCLSKDDCMADLFLPDIFTKIKEVASSATVEISDTTDDGLPRNICHICLHKLEEWFDFKSQFIKTSKELVDYLHGNSDFSNHIPSTKRKIDDSLVSENTRNAKLQQLKKRKIDFELPTLEPVIKKNDENNEKDIKTIPKNDVNDTKIGVDSTSGSQLLQNTSPTTKGRQLGPRKTNEQRLPSTQRWEARKKALLAINGESVSDSDTITSDDTQLSPIQKARVKNNAQKDVDYIKNSANSMNNLGKTEAEKLSSSMIIDLTSPKTNNNNNNNNIDKKNKNNSTENIINSELVIGDETYIITTTLTVTNSQFVNNIKINDLPILIETKQQDIERQNNEEKREMLDAMQLRPVENKNNKNLIKNCLTLEVAAPETESLTRMQKVIKKFIDDDIKKKIENNDFSNNKILLKKPNDSYQTLEQKLKTLIENAVKKNINKNKINNKNIESFTSEFIKAAEKSKLFQPKVLLDRIEPVESFDKSKNNKTITDNCESIDENIEKKNLQILPVVKPLTKKPKTTTKKIQNDSSILSLNSTNNTNNSNNTNNNEFEDDDDTEIIDITMNDVSINNTTINDENSEEISRHVCGDCGAVFSTTEEVKQHFDEHNNEPKKPKVKRCKRCKVIVDAKLVATHVCRNKITHNCLTCNTTFKTDKMLEKHMKIHKDEHSNIKRVNNLANKKNIDKINKNDILNDDYCKNNTKFDCYVCDKIFDNEIILNNHLQNHFEKNHINKNAVKIDGIAENKSIEITTNTTQQEFMTTQKLEELLSENIDEITAEINNAETLNNNNNNNNNNNKIQQFSNDYFGDNDNSQNQTKDTTNDTVLCGMCPFDIPLADVEKHINEHLLREGAVADETITSKININNNENNEDNDDNDNVEYDSVEYDNVEYDNVENGDTLNHENNTIDQTNVEETFVESETKVLLYDCVQCNEKFESEQNLDQHMTTHEEDTVYDEFEDNLIKSQNKHLCTVCNLSFDNENTLAEHLDSNCESNSTTCGICNEKLPTFEEFESHVAGHFT